MDNDKNKALKLSIITPVYNVEKYLAKCLDSLMDQGLLQDEYEIIVVNDGSTDSSLEIANGYASLYSNIKVVSQENGGISVARNTGVDIARGEYVYFIDSDDYLIRGALCQILAIADEHDADVVTFKSHHVYEDVEKNQEIGKCKVPNLNIQVLTGLEADEQKLLPEALTAWFFIVKREFLHKHNLRFYPEMRYSEDLPVTLPMFLNAKKVVITNIDAYCYLQRPGSTRHGKSREKELEMTDYDLKCCVLVNDINNKWQGVRSDIGNLRTKSFLNSLIFFAILRMLRIGIPSKEISKRLTLLESKGLYPIDYISHERASQGIKMRLLHWLVNKRMLVSVASGIFSKLKS